MEHIFTETEYKDCPVHGHTMHQVTFKDAQGDHVRTWCFDSRTDEQIKAIAASSESKCIECLFPKKEAE